MKSTQHDILPSTRKIKHTVSQRNHEVSFIPDSVAKYHHEPLYIIIALWCQQQARWINRNDISLAFQMPTRRASFQLSYMSRKPKRVSCKVRQKILEYSDGRRYPCNEVWVEQVLRVDNMPEDEKKSPPEHKKGGLSGPHRGRVGNGMSSNASALWHSLVMQRAEKPKEE